MSYHQRARATYLLDTLAAAEAELSHWLVTGQFTTCGQCSQRVPAADAAGTPGRHQLGRLGRPGVWCEPPGVNNAMNYYS
jgi:hypothetical protein